MPSLTPEQLAALREAAEKATKGEWSFHKADNSPGAVVYGVRIEDCGRSIDCWSLTYNGEGAANAAYIVAAQPGAVLALLDEIERLRGALATAASRFEALAAHDNTMRNGARPSVGAAEARAALAPKEKNDG